MLRNSSKQQRLNPVVDLDLAAWSLPFTCWTWMPCHDVLWLHTSSPPGFLVTNHSFKDQGTTCEKLQKLTSNFSLGSALCLERVSGLSREDTKYSDPPDPWTSVVMSRCCVHQQEDFILCETQKSVFISHWLALLDCGTEGDQSWEPGHHDTLQCSLSGSHTLFLNPHLADSFDELMRFTLCRTHAWKLQIWASFVG